MADTAILPDWAAHYVQENVTPHMHVVNVLPIDKGGLKGAFLLNTSKGAVVIQKGRLGDVDQWLLPLPGEHITFSCKQCSERMDLVDPEVPRAVFCSACGHQHFLVIQSGELAVVEGDAPSPDDITAGYTLYRRGRGGQATYFFAKSKPRNARPAELPKDATVEANPRTGVPEVRLPETTTGTAYYAYRGAEQPVAKVEGIGDAYAQRLAEAGVETTARLLFEDAASLGARVDVPEKRVRRWQAQAELMLIKGVGPQYAEALARSGIDSVNALKRGDAQAIADQVNVYLDALGSQVVGQKVTVKRVQGWQSAASTMRKVRSKVPAR